MVAAVVENRRLGGKGPDRGVDEIAVELLGTSVLFDMSPLKATKSIRVKSIGLQSPAMYSARPWMSFSTTNERSLPDVGKVLNANGWRE